MKLNKVLLPHQRDKTMEDDDNTDINIGDE